MYGSHLTNRHGIYGEKGVPSENNYPGSRYNFALSQGSDGIVWLFGGSNSYGESGTGGRDNSFFYLYSNKVV